MAQNKLKRADTNANTGTGDTFVFATSPTLVTPVLGVATATSVNGVTFSGTGSVANSGVNSISSFTGSGASSGTNTGDNATNTQYSGLVSNATHTGDATGATALTLATVNANVGSFTNGSFTVNGKGLVTAASSGAAPVTSVGATAPLLSSGGSTPTITTSINTNKLMGRSTAGVGVMEEITLGTNLSFTGTTLNAAGGGGGSMAIGGSITSATAGSVLFAGAAGILQQDNANFFWDDTNNRLGIGTATPSVPLQVVGDANVTGSLRIGPDAGKGVISYSTNAIQLGPVGGPTFTFNNVGMYLGQAGQSFAQTISLINQGSGTNYNAGDFTFITGAGTGAGIAGSFLFQTADVTTSGTTPQAVTTKMTLLGNGNLGLSVTPTARVHAAAGTAIAGTAPFKINTGTALTTPENGAFEFHTAHLYFTIAGVRYQLDQQTGGGGGDMVLASTQTNSGVKTFLDTTMKLRNVANTFDGSFVNTNTANRIYTLKDAAGTLAFVSDITGTNSGTNTGDQTITLTGGVTGSGTGSFAATVVTNANLTGDVTSVGNATTLTNAPVIAKVLTGYVSGAGTVAATDSILVAIQKLNGNNATNANLTGPITSVGNTTSVASQTGTGSTFVMNTSPTLVTPVLGVASATSLTLSGNISNAAWTTTGIRIKGIAATLTDTTSTGTVAAAYTDAFGGNTIAASSATTYTDYVTAYFREPIAGTNVTFTRKTALGADSLSVGTSNQLTVSLTGVLTATSPVLNTPVITGLSTGTGVASAATASTLVSRDSSGNANAVHFNEGFTTTATAAGTTTLTMASTKIQVLTGSTTQTVVLPVTSTLVQGFSFYIVNTSTGAVTVNSSGANLVFVIAAGTTALVTCILNSGTTAASWVPDVYNISAISGKKAAFNNTLTLAGTDGTLITFPTTSATIARTDAANTFTGVQTTTQVLSTNNAITAAANAATIPVTSKVHTVTNNSAGTLTLTLTTAGAIDRQMVVICILDFSAVAQTISWVNTENSTVTVPATSNGSTTLPLTVGFMYNNATSKWRCVASA